MICPQKALKKKHSKNDDDSKFLGTLLGKCIEHGEVQVEGGEFPSISNWEEKLRAAAQRSPSAQAPETNGDGDSASRPGSSGLSSLGDRSIADEMELS